jgi:translation initiation factor 3 subunit M
MIDTEIEGFFNLIYSHLFALHPPGTPEAEAYLMSLLQTISSATSDRPSIKYRMCVKQIFREPRNSDSFRL